MPEKHIDIDNQIFQKLDNLREKGENFSNVIDRLLKEHQDNQATLLDEVLPTSVDFADFLKRKT